MNEERRESIKRASSQKVKVKRPTVERCKIVQIISAGGSIYGLDEKGRLYRGGAGDWSFVCHSPEA